MKTSLTAPEERIRRPNLMKSSSEEPRGTGIPWLRKLAPLPKCVSETARSLDSGRKRAFSPSRWIERPLMEIGIGNWGLGEWIGGRKKGIFTNYETFWGFKVLYMICS